MGKPAARIGDHHVCPKVSPGGVPHAGGQIIGPGSPSVFIEKKPAATVDDACLCVGGLDKIESGSTGVFINGKPAARVGDRCEHGGRVVTGSGTVFIGEKKGKKQKKPDTAVVEKELSKEEKAEAINQAIEDCTALLERKLKLLEQDDPDTLEQFKKWFGREDAEARDTILKILRRALKYSEKLTFDNFEELTEEKERRETCAISYPTDDLLRIKVGGIFWKVGAIGKDSKAGAIIHELSHFKDVGDTEDAIYGENDCLKLAIRDPGNALKNASSFELFVVE